MEPPAPASGPVHGQRRWELVSVAWNQVGKYLDEGWEPFAVTTAYGVGAQPVVYLRRRRAE